MNPLNRMNPGAVITCTCKPNDEGVLKCNGQHGRIERPVTADEAVNIIQHAYTGNGYGVAINPLLEEPATIDEHVALIRARGASLERWTHNNERIATDGPIIRELIARMEGNLQALRTLVKDIEKAENE